MKSIMMRYPVRYHSTHPVFCSAAIVAGLALLQPALGAQAQPAAPSQPTSSAGPTTASAASEGAGGTVATADAGSSAGSHPVELAQSIFSPSTGGIPAMDTIVSLNNVKDAPIQDVLKALAEQSGTNIVTAGALTGNVTLTLRRVTVGQALDLITRLNKLAYRMDPRTNTIVIGTPEQLRLLVPDQAPTVIPVLHASAADVAAALTKGFPDLAITANGTRSVTISGPSDHAAQAEALLRTLDVAPTAAPVGHLVLALHSASSKEIETSLTRVYPELAVVGEPNGQVLLSGSMPEIQSAVQLVQQLDVSPAAGQGAVRTLIYQARHADVFELRRILYQEMPDIEAIPGPGPGFAGSGGSSGSTMSTSTSGPATSAGGSAGGEASGAAGGAGGGAAASGGSSMSAGGSSTGLAMRTSMLILTGPQTRLDAALALLSRVDVLPPQVLIEARVMDLDLQKMSNIGMNWSFSSGFSFGELGVTTTATASATGNTVTTSGSQVPIFPFTPGAPLSRSPISASLDLNAQNSNSKVLASPKLIAESDRPASIFIGDQISYISSINQAVTGQSVTTSTENVGISLNILSHVDPNGEITLNVSPNVSVLTQFVATTNGAQLPLISERSAETVMRLVSGQTIAIGGLIQDSDLKTMSKIPFLGDLPFFGALFRHRSTNHERSEVVIFIRATVLPGPTPEEASAAAAAVAASGAAPDTSSIPGPAPIPGGTATPGATEGSGATGPLASAAPIGTAPGV